MDNQEQIEHWKEQGRISARSTQVWLKGKMPPPETLLADARTRDSMRKEAKNGDKEALKQASFLDGFLSMWD